MTTYTGTQTVEQGIYLNTKTYAIEMMDKAGTLAGAELDTYRRIPMIVMLAAAPLLGLAFVMFLPLVGFAMMLRLIGTKVAHLMTAVAADGVRVLRPSSAPALPLFTRSKPVVPPTAAGNPAAENPTDAWEEKVEKKLGNDDRTAR